MDAQNFIDVPEKYHNKALVILVVIILTVLVFIISFFAYTGKKASDPILNNSNISELEARQTLLNTTFPSENLNAEQIRSRQDVISKSSVPERLSDEEIRARQILLDK